MKFTVADLLYQLPLNEALPIAQLEKALSLSATVDKQQLRIGIHGLISLACWMTPRRVWCALRRQS